MTPGVALFYGGMVRRKNVISMITLCLVVIAYAFTLTFLLGRIVDATIGLRVSEVEEYVGLDISQHGETAYQS